MKLRSSLSKLAPGYVPGTGVALWTINGLAQRLMRLDGDCRYGKHFTSRVLHSKELSIEDECSDVRRSLAVSGGCYINAADGLHIGRGTIWSANVGIISQDHDFNDFDLAPPTKGIRIGRSCWIGFGAVILPGVTLGDHTIVGANSVVNRSFPDGHVVIAGAPALQIRRLSSEHQNL
ncbi:MAG: acyltransferase [Afipia sp.]|nr:acyltransferase [Afipia sp.]